MKIAVIGSGIAGLGAAYLLSRAYDVAVFEKNGYAGGHSNTVDAPTADGGSIPVDTGFIVYNERTYPNLTGLFDHLGVARIRTDMSFAVSADRGRLEYGGSDLGTLFAQKRNILNPRFYLMIRDILRFYKEAPELLADGGCADITLKQFLRRGGYSPAFVDDHLLPMAAAIWSCPVGAMGAFPAASVIRFFDNHGLLRVENRPQWWTVKNGSRAYVERIRAALTRTIATETGVVAVTRQDGGVIIRTTDGRARRFDHAVLACHGDEAHGLLSDRTPKEAAILSQFVYQKNRAILHGDPRQMPVRRKVWSSWNYLGNHGAGREEKRVSVTYWMNRLQSLDAAPALFVTLNPIEPIAEDRVVAAFDYDHPVFDQGAMGAQRRLPEIQGQGGVWYCGSYCGHGFHEDGLGAAVAVARAFGVAAPWGRKPVHAMRAVDPTADAAAGASDSETAVAAMA